MEGHLDYHHPASPYPVQLELVASTYVEAPRKPYSQSSQQHTFQEQGET
jgi:hypothetical protein